jgi:hypothetical protein
MVVSILQINITKVFGPCELIKEVVNSGNWVLVPYCGFIQIPVINAESSGLVFLLHQYDWAPTR